MGHARYGLFRLLVFAGLGLILLFLQILLNSRIQRLLKEDAQLARQLVIEKQQCHELSARLELLSKPDRVFQAVDRHEYRRVNPERILLVRFTPEAKSAKAALP